MQVSNIYYNAANPTYYTGTGPVNPTGSPDFFATFGSTTFKDTLTLGPSDAVYLRYLFHYEGNITNAQYSNAYLSFSAGQYSTSFNTFSTQSSGFISGDWTTPDWAVASGSPILMSGDFYAQVVARSQYTQGVDVNGTSDFSNTLALSSIQLLDANGNQVNGATYLTASGTHYNILGAKYGPAAVPEPGSVALLVGVAVSGAGFLARRRQKR